MTLMLHDVMMHLMMRMRQRLVMLMLLLQLLLLLIDVVESGQSEAAIQMM